MDAILWKDAQYFILFGINYKEYFNDDNENLSNNNEIFKFINKSLNLDLLYMTFSIIKARWANFNHQDIKNISYLFEIT